jgi:hypothetical protein
MRLMNFTGIVDRVRIPKNKRANNIKQFRPICLLNVCSKISPKHYPFVLTLYLTK